MSDKCPICGRTSINILEEEICGGCCESNILERQIILGRRIEKIESLAKNPILIGPSSVKR